MKQSMKHEVIRYAMMVLACLIYAVGFCFFIEPNNIVAGAMTGLAMVINKYISQIPVGIWGIILNIPIVVIAFFQEGKKFTFNCLVTLLVLVQNVKADSFYYNKGLINLKRKKSKGLIKHIYSLLSPLLSFYYLNVFKYFSKIHLLLRGWGK